MTALPPIDFNVPLDLNAILTGNPVNLSEYFAIFHEALREMQLKTSNSVFGFSEDFQPSINNSGKTATIDDADYDKRTGTYHRIGNLCWVSIEVHYTGTDVTGTGDLIIQELPFNAKKVSLFNVFDDDNATDPVGLCQVAAGDKDLTTFVVGSATLEQVEADHNLIISGVYAVDS